MPQVSTLANLSILRKRSMRRLMTRRILMRRLQKLSSLCTLLKVMNSWSTVFLTRNRRQSLTRSSRKAKLMKKKQKLPQKTLMANLPTSLNKRKTSLKLSSTAMCQRWSESPKCTSKRCPDWAASWPYLSSTTAVSSTMHWKRPLRITWSFRKSVRSKRSRRRNKKSRWLKRNRLS